VTHVDGPQPFRSSRRDSGAPVLLWPHLIGAQWRRFDGALGVTAALEVLQGIKEWRTCGRLSLEAIDFTDMKARWWVVTVRRWPGN
jgi:hypothetical protein